MHKNIAKKGKKSTSKKCLKKKNILISIAVIIVMVIVACICIVLLSKKDDSGDTDFSYKVTDINGEEFIPNYDSKHDKDFSIRFADLECNEDCSNVSTVKIGDKTLKLGEDYEIKHGSIIIIIYKKVMQALQSGNYDIVVNLEYNSKTITVGVHITINNAVTVGQNENQSNETNQPANTNSDNMNDYRQDESPSNSNSTSEPTTSPTLDPTPEPDQPEQPKTCSELQNCDFNLNDRYIIETDRYNFYRLPEGATSLCEQNESGVYYLEALPVIETRVFYQIGNFTGEGGGSVPHATPTRTDYTYSQAEQYAASKGLSAFHDGWGCGGMGDTWREWTWQETIDGGFALDEAKCATWDLSCGRW